MVVKKKPKRIKIFYFKQHKKDTKNKITSQSIYKKLSKTDKEIINNFKIHLQGSASVERSKEGVREVLRFQKVLGKPFNDINISDLEYFLKELNKKHFADYSMNKIKGFVCRFLKWKFPKEWKDRFNEFASISYNNEAERKTPMGEKDILTKAEIEKIMKTEHKLYWKTFFMVQYQGALRTLETRKLAWSEIEDDGKDEFCFLKITSKKNKNAKKKIREIPLKEATYFLRELKKQQEEQGIESLWVFHGNDPKTYISKAVNMWLKKLTKKAIGRSVTNYNLRHTRATELKTMVLKNKMSKDNAIAFMGHSEKMFDKVYSHTERAEAKKIMKNQIYKLEYMPKKKKHELEEQIDKLEKQLAVFGVQEDRLKKVEESSIKSKADNKKIMDELKKMKKANIPMTTKKAKEIGII